MPHTFASYRRPLLTVTVLQALLSVSSSAQVASPARLHLVGSFNNPAINESSGVAVSRSHSGIIWTHNDSGSDPLIFATSLSGNLVAVFDVRGAESEDWEDMSLGPCPNSVGDCLYIADTGNNRLRRRRVSIYVVPEPDPFSGRPDTVIKTERALRIRFRYPDREAYDVEAIAVSPEGDVELISKGRTGLILRFLLERDQLTDEGTARASLVDELPIVPVRNLGRWVTGAAISPSGRRLVVRTLTELYLFTRSVGELSPDGPPCWLGWVEPQGEAVDFYDETVLVTTSERVLGHPGLIHLVNCP